VIVSPLDLAVVPIAVDGGRDWLAIALGAWGAVLSTALAVSQLVRDRPGVKLRLNALSVVSEVDGEETPRDFWELRIINHRKRPITIRRAGVFGDRQQHLMGIPFVDPERIEDGHPAPVNPFPESLTDGTSFSLFFELDLQRDRHRAGAYVIDDFGRIYKVLKPTYSLKRRIAEWRARRQFEESSGGRAALIREWRPWRWWPNRWP
jgi:hypothetical protein